MLDVPPPPPAPQLPPSPADDPARTHSDSWYRLAGQRVALRPHVTVHRQIFRGERWQVLRDPFNNRFFRLTPAAWEFVARLRGDRTIEEVWHECREADVENAPGQEEVVGLLADLWNANLLHGTLPPDSERLFERHRKGRLREVRSFWLSLMFARIPLFDPDRFLVAALPWVRPLFSWAGAVLWLVVVGLGLKVVADHWSELADRSLGLLAPDNLFWLYAGMVLLKTCHEFGHAFACRHFGGEVHTMGVMLLVFTPVPYVDATSSWALRSRWQRALIGGAGMIVELFLAALAAFVWAATGPGVVNSIAYNMMFVASVSTLLFNLNPLLRFDGYYILSDLLDLPNLHSRSARQLTHLCERYLFGLTRSRSPAATRREAAWLTGFGIASNIYRVLVFVGITLFVADRWLLLGALFAVYCLVSFIGVPLFKLVRYLATSPRLARKRPRALAVVGGGAAVLLLVLGVVPFPHHFRAPGVLEAGEHTIVTTDAAGRLAAIAVPSGRRVRAGEELLRLEDPELALQRAIVAAQLEETEALLLRALRERGVDRAPLEARREAIRRRSAELDRREQALVLRAPHDGWWSAPAIDRLVGTWLPRGTALGLVANPSSFHLAATVLQEEAAQLFEPGRLRRAEVRLRGEEGRTLAVSEERVLPSGRKELPSAALGWAAGGTVPVAGNDRTGRQAREEFFEVRATVVPRDGVALTHGRSGWVRFTLPPEPLLSQWGRRLRQMLQRRFGL